jgi:membrane protein
MNFRSTWALLKDTAADWSEDEVPRMSGALAYYTLLSLAPLLVLAVSIAGLVFGDDAARGQVSQELTSLMGAQASEAIETILTHAKGPEKGIAGTIVGGAVLLFGASGVFGELQSALNTIWKVEPKPGRGVWGVVRDRFFSFTMVLGVAFLLLVSLVLSAALSAVGAFFSGQLPGGEVLWQIVNGLLSLVIVTALFALLFSFVPDVKVRFSDVLPGAALTAVLFTVGKFLLGFYLARASVTSAYGAAGSLIVLVIWVYYTSQIMLSGAEFTQVYTRRRKPVEPSSQAVPKPEAVAPPERAQAEAPRVLPQRPASR